jgi:hypothetical protein
MPQRIVRGRRHRSLAVHRLRIGQKTMIHYTLNTGQTHLSPLHEVPANVIMNLQKYMHPGAYKFLESGPLKLEVLDVPNGYAGTLFWRGAILAIFYVADTLEAASCVWPAIEKIYLEITDRGDLASADFEAPKMPISLPWLSVVLIKPDYLRETRLSQFLSYLERRLAWTWIER